MTNTEEIEGLLSAYQERVISFTLALRPFSYRIRSKPLIGGAFGAGAFSLCSLSVAWHGLDHTLYLVRHDGSELMLSTADTKAEAMAGARKYMTWLSSGRLSRLFVAYRDRLAIEIAAEKAQQEAELADRQAARKSEVPVRSIPKRRRQIFNASNGKCHYCDAALTLDGKWHIEHKMPRALLGGSEQSNLVASCVPCNQKKRDRTDLEFKASQGLQGAA